MINHGWLERALVRFRHARAAACPEGTDGRPFEVAASNIPTSVWPASPHESATPSPGRSSRKLRVSLALFWAWPSARHRRPRQAVPCASRSRGPVDLQRAHDPCWMSAGAGGAAGGCAAERTTPRQSVGGSGEGGEGKTVPYPARLHAAIADPRSTESRLTELVRRARPARTRSPPATKAWVPCECRERRPRCRPCSIETIEHRGGAESDRSCTSGPVASTPRLRCEASRPRTKKRK